MGSYNEICTLSNLNITYGTPIRLLLLSQNTNNRDTNHNTNWYCRTPPLKGHYNDYGQAKLRKSPLHKLITNLLNQDIIEKQTGLNKHTQPQVKKNQTLQHYLEAAQHNRLEIRHIINHNPTIYHDHHYSTIKAIMIREDIWQLYLNTNNDQKTIKEKITKQYNNLS